MGCIYLSGFKGLLLKASFIHVLMGRLIQILNLNLGDQLLLHLLDEIVILHRHVDHRGRLQITDDEHIVSGWLACRVLVAVHGGSGLLLTQLRVGQRLEGDQRFLRILGASI